MAAKPYRPKQTAAEKKAYKNRNFGAAGKTGGMGGKYGRKSENLSKKELKASGGLAASRKRTVDISQTRREGQFTLGPGGKRLTGTVNLGGGKTAVYKGGKRVQATPASKGGGGGRAKPSVSATRVSPSARGEGAGGRKGNRQALSGTVSSAISSEVNKISRPNNRSNIPFGGTKKPTGKEIGPGRVGVRNPKDGGLYRFGGPGNMETFRWDAKSGKFVKVR
jgi:hypothetical protein